MITDQQAKSKEPRLQMQTTNPLTGGRRNRPQSSSATREHFLPATNLTEERVRSIKWPRRPWRGAPLSVHHDLRVP